MSGKGWRATATWLAAVAIASLTFAGNAWAASEIVLYTFSGASDGTRPWAGLAFDQQGNLYGTAASSGPGGLGTVFELTPVNGGGWQLSVLFAFTGGNDGGNPYAGVTFDAQGNLYGTTQAGGAYGAGTVFELSPAMGGGWTESVLYSFSGGTDGKSPFSGVILDPEGNLYGTTNAGGTYSLGTVFKLTPPGGGGGGWSESVLHSFSNIHDGANPYAGLVRDYQGNLYGTTVAGGSGAGTVFKLAPPANRETTWTESVIHSFRGGRDGAAPYADLILDAAGNLYGTTSGGGIGQYGYGIVFMLSPPNPGKVTWTESAIYRFTGKNGDGAYPYARLVLDGQGNLYGTTQNGGARAGTVFKLSPPIGNGPWIETVLYSFASLPNGAYPFAGVILDNKGNLYGTTSLGGRYGVGVVFEIMP